MENRMRRFRSTVLFVLTVLSLGANAIEQTDCLKDGDAVSLVGKIWRETFPGPPNYESIEEGDEPETVWVLTLDQPRCILGVSMETGKTYQIGRITRFQLALTPEQYNKHRRILEKRAKVNGKLFQAVSGHHHTKALIEVNEFGAAAQIENPSIRHEIGKVEIFPSHVRKTRSYKPFSILSTRLGKQMSDAYIANTFLCKSPAETLQVTMDLLQNYDLVGTSKTDGTLTITSFRGIQQGTNVTVSLAVDEKSNPRLVRYILIDGIPTLSCQ